MKKLKDLRKKMGFTCAQMAEKLNMCTAYYWQIENNQRGLYYQTAKRLQQFLI